ncbi:phosphonate C-P lyase system protein PhnH [Mesorhizobium sp. B4-1-4]|uniref:phosphonate C-P lyase system protein PhnH n=1 Tax=Mesorhizobium sp. B4-1-4 TaxID=2589888 RepID=UPI00112E44C5|nr:phosphonate C-P lyase system protein PhnH [Mesorhizobium sp. B4-1-4]UCI31737.1 phosphonate C-P lyase system protein PhnH [Mesorhizobium sp. B4-1-4]
MPMRSLAQQFEDPIHDAQLAFRELLTALSRPGTVVKLRQPLGSPHPLNGTMAAIALTLVDGDCPTWLSRSIAMKEVRDYLHLHTNALLTAAPETASLAFVGDAADLPSLSCFHPGEAACPDKATTVVIRLPSLSGGRTITLSGPGIEATAAIDPAGLPDWFWPEWKKNAATYPLGVDVFLIDDAQVIGLPRSTKADW